MILLVHSDMTKITDFIMWADVEFAMQLELLETKRFGDQAVGIADLRSLSKLAGMQANEPLFVICHGSPGGPKSYLDGEEYEWRALGEAIGDALVTKPSRIELYACWGGSGMMPTRPVDKLARGVGLYMPGVTIVGYQGATVTNTMGTIGARDAANGGVVRPVQVADDRRLGVLEKFDAELRQQSTPQEKFNSFLQGNPTATPRQKAIAAATESESFYLAFGSGAQAGGLYYPASSDLSRPVRVTS